MYRHFKIFFICNALLMLLSAMLSNDVKAQFLGDNFGKNRVQQKKFKWMFVSTANCDVYFYDGGRDLANYVARYAEQNFDRITRLVGFSPYTKIKLIVYNSVADAQQSNIGLEDPDMQVGGYTSFVKSIVEVPFRGTREQLNKDVDKGISQVLLSVMMYGGNLTDVVQSSYLLSLPEWFLEGASRYIADGWSIEMDNYIRDLFKDTSLKKPSLMVGKQAHIVGQSMWNFIAKKYGEEQMANILNLTRIIRNEKESIENTLGIPYNAFLNEWKSYYYQMKENTTETYIAAPEKEFRLKKNTRKNYDYRNLSISPDGSKLAYSQSFEGKYKITIIDSTHKSKSTIMKGGYTLINQPDNRNIPIVAWQSDIRLAYITTKGNDSYLNFYTFFDKKFYEINRKRKVKILLDNVKEVLSMDFSKDGKFIVMSAVRKAQSDIYIYDVYNDKLRQITNDVYDDLAPKFAGSTNSIVFSSNRYTDSTTKAKDQVFSHNTKFNILKFTPTDSARVFEKYTADGNNYQPVKVNGGILFLSDRTGILNLFKVTDDGRILKQVTNYKTNINYYTINEEQQLLSFVMLNDGRENIYELRDFNFEQSLPPSTNTDRANFFAGQNNRKNKKSAPLKEANPSNSAIDVDISSFNFESDKKKRRKDKSEGMPKSTEAKVFNSLGPYMAKPMFSVDHFVTTFKIDPLRGFGIFADAGMSDMMGNNRVYAGALVMTDLSSSSVFAEYQYLKNRIDYKVRFDRNKYNLFGESQIFHEYTLNSVTATASLPLSVFDRISFSPMFTQTRYAEVPTPTTRSFAIVEDDVLKQYLGYKLEYVHDKNKITGMNMMVGSRWKVAYDHYYTLGDQVHNFGKLYLDFRNYQKIHKQVIFATRLSGGFFVGNSPKNFLLGGVEDWLFRSVKEYPNNDPLLVAPGNDNSDILFSPFITNIRGFQYNAAFGNKFLLLNAELRMPLVKYLYNGPIVSNFLRNLQLITFYDIGSAWSGTSPFNQNNTINTTVIGDGNPVKAEVTNYISPWLYSYGAGLRTLFVGYYIKLDVAWGVVDYQVQSPKLLISIGYDF